jgi:hypothetical protein
LFPDQPSNSVKRNRRRCQVNVSKIRDQSFPASADQIFKDEELMKIRQLITEAEKKTDESGNFGQAGSGSGMAGRIYGTCQN